MSQFVWMLPAHLQQAREEELQCQLLHTAAMVWYLDSTQACTRAWHWPWLQKSLLYFSTHIRADSAMYFSACLATSVWIAPLRSAEQLCSTHTNIFKHLAKFLFSVVGFKIHGDESPLVEILTSPLEPWGLLLLESQVPLRTWPCAWAMVDQCFSEGFKQAGCPLGQTRALEICSHANKPSLLVPGARGCLHPPHKLFPRGAGTPWMPGVLCFKQPESSIDAHCPNTFVPGLSENYI